VSEALQHFVDRVVDWAWLVLVAVVGWAWRINDRMTTLEAKHAATDQLVQRMDEKLDSILDHLINH
jgi:hypothetical protein